MKKYEVQINTLFDGWVNTWQIIDENGQAEPETFESYAAAEAALDEFLAEIEEEIANDQRAPEDRYSLDEFRIVATTPAKQGE